MQVLADEGLENGRHAGLGWISGTVRRIASTAKQYKVPHMGWNDVQIERSSRLLAGLPEAPVFYFVHSYYFDPAPDSQETVIATASHGMKIPAAVERGNIFGVQFHPEKSQRVGLTVLENFLKLV
jgi:glutamine amidotransferase